MVRILEDLAQDWRRLDERIEAVTGEIEALSKNAEPCQHLTTIPGIGPIISSAVVAAIGNGAVFSDLWVADQKEFPAGVSELDLRRWENRLAVASVIWWHYWPSRA